MQNTLANRSANFLVIKGRSLENLIGYHSNLAKSELLMVHMSKKINDLDRSTPDPIGYDKNFDN